VLDLFGGINRQEVVTAVRLKIKALHDDIEINDRVLRVTIRGVVKSLHPYLQFFDRTRLTDEVYEEIKDEKI